MGVFDYLRCTYPLPEGAPIDGYQTKCLDAQWMEQYELRADGTLWFLQKERETVIGEQYPLGFILKTISEEWVQEVFTGEVRFYGGSHSNGDWWKFSAYFVKGELKHLETLERPAQ